MRAVVFLLVFANLIFFAWANGHFGAEPASDAGRMDQQLNPERMRIVARGVAPTPSRPLPPPPDQCAAWGGLIAAEADRLAKAVAEAAPGLKISRRTESTSAKTWWLFIAPQANKADLDRKVGELRKLEIGDFFVVQEPGPNRNAISLGVFSTEEAAKAHLEALRAKGVKSAKVGPRSGVEQHVAVEARGPVAAVEAARAAVREPPAGDCVAPARANGKPADAASAAAATAQAAAPAAATGGAPAARPADAAAASAPPVPAGVGAAPEPRKSP